jgi:predicted peptidase
MKRLSVTMLAALLVVGCLAVHGFAQESAVKTSSEAKPKPNPLTMFEPRQYVDDAGKTLNYRLLKPADFSPDKKYPLVIFLHGAGERGDDNAAQLKHCMVDFCTPERRTKYPCYVLAPQCPTGEKWADIDWSAEQPTYPEKISGSLGLTMQVVDTMLADAAVDSQRVYVCGLSMGGFGTWDALSRRPNFFAAAIPICGGGDVSRVASFKQVPIWCFHGSDDQVVKVEKSRALIEALKAAGGEPRYTEYPGVGHNSWSQTFADEATYQWLFSQKRRATATP